MPWFPGLWYRIALREALEYGKINDGYETLAKTVFCYHGDA